MPSSFSVGPPPNPVEPSTSVQASLSSEDPPIIPLTFPSPPISQMSPMRVELNESLVDRFVEANQLMMKAMQEQVKAARVFGPADQEI